MSVVDLEHSLVSLSKWEAKHQKPFLSHVDRSGDEIFDYVKAMIITPDFPEDMLLKLCEKDFREIQDYMESPQSATTVYIPKRKPAKPEVITSELIYYWMVAAQIPFECQFWHLNRLLKLIQIYQIKNTKPEKRSSAEINRERSEENARRLALLKTSG